MIEITRKNDSEGDRRRYFRVDDELVLTVNRLDHDLFDEELARFEEKRKSIGYMNNIELEKENLFPLRQKLENLYPEIAEYIAHLEKRLDMLSQTVMQDNNESYQAPQKVNISAQGIRFYSDEIFAKDDMVELRLILQPSQKILLIIGCVVWCVEDPNAVGKEKNVVAVDFTYINEADRDVLIKHIQPKQIKILSQNEACS
ncbi:MAG: PilZ domain-containing protein [Gammaproteobacteria bacterium]|nr:PilZ domain-containing protein [Gammaproteobacteria bacterium]